MIDELFEEFKSYKEKQKTEGRRKADFDIACNTFNMELKEIQIELEAIRVVLPHDRIPLDE